MEAVDLTQLAGLDRALEGLLREFPELRRELHEQLGELMKREVDAAIAGSGLRDSAGQVRRWQIVHIGSGGGYAAVRAAGEKEGGGTGRESAGAITNYLENGHHVRLPAGKSGYRSRIKTAYVNGFHFYQTARTASEAKAIRLAEDFTEKLAERLEGGA